MVHIKALFIWFYDDEVLYVWFEMRGGYVLVDQNWSNFDPLQLKKIHFQEINLENVSNKITKAN